MVIVSQSDSFEFVFLDNEELSMASTRTVSVGSQNGTSVLFPIRLLALGEIPISVEAKSSVASDAVRRMVLVKVQVTSFTLLWWTYKSVKAIHFFPLIGVSNECVCYFSSNTQISFLLNFFKGLFSLTQVVLHIIVPLCVILFCPCCFGSLKDLSSLFRRPCFWSWWGQRKAFPGKWRLPSLQMLWRAVSEHKWLQSVRKHIQLGLFRSKSQASDQKLIFNGLLITSTVTIH